MLGRPLRLCCLPIIMMTRLKQWRCVLRGSAVRACRQRAVRIYQGVLFVRPFLCLRKSDLIAVCKAYRVEYLTDPSNTDQTFERARVRASTTASQWLLQQQLVQLSSLTAQLSERLADALAEWCAQYGFHLAFTSAD